MLLLSDADFTRLHTYIRAHYGIDLSRKKQLISSRLTNTLEQKGYQSFSEYVDEIISGRNPEMVSVMLNKLTTNYTYFMREKEHFDFLQNRILPELEKKHMNDRTIAIWSAGCSSGEEPYTISMYLREYFSKRPGKWDTRILATDISERVLASAKNPSYSAESIHTLPASWQKRYFVQQPDNTYGVSKELRDNVIFRSFNLMDTIRFRRKFDLIFCRNVMIYFNHPTKVGLIRRFYDATLPGGYLFIGHSESLDKDDCPFTYLEPAIYQRLATHS